MKYALGLLLVAGSHLGHAQTRHFGLKAGGNFSRFVGADVPDNDLISTSYGFGLSVGAVAEIGLATHWAVQPELLYSLKGSKLTYYDLSDAQTYTQRLGYLDVPVLLKYKTHHVFFEAGPQFGLLVHANGIFERGTSATETNDRGNFHLADVGYAAGVGVQDTNGLLLGVRYNGGLTNVYADNSRARNSSFQLYVGYLFGSHD